MILHNYTSCVGISSAVEAVHNEMGGSGLDTWQGPFKFSTDLFFLSTFISSGVHSACNRNEYQGISWRVKCGQCVELTVVPTVQSIF